MKIAVTGATGFVGRFTVKRLIESGHDVVALCRDPSKTSIPAVEFDLGVAPSSSLLRSFHAVVHLAAFLPPAYDDAAHAQRCLELNALGTLALARAAADAGVATFVATSSGNAYAWTNRAVREDDALYPANRATYYLTSKVAGEVFAAHIGRVTGMRVVTLRPSAIFGPGLSGGLVSSVTHRMRARERVTLRDGGLYAVDLVYVEDVVEAILQTLFRPVGGAFNIGSGRATTTLDLTKQLAEILRVEPAIDVLPPSPNGPDVGFAPLDITRARAELDFVPRSLVSGLKSYVASLGDA